jgi:hypothetical protein
MAERFNFGSIEDAIVMLFNNNTSDLNTGLLASVVKITTDDPDKPVALPSYPAICVYFRSGSRTFRGASKRKQVDALYEIHFWTNNKYSLDASKDEADLLLDNILYILDGNVELVALSSSNGWLDPASISYNYSTNDTGFSVHGVIQLTIHRLLN